MIHGINRYTQLNKSIFDEMKNLQIVTSEGTAVTFKSYNPETECTTQILQNSEKKPLMLALYNNNASQNTFTFHEKIYNAIAPEISCGLTSENQICNLSKKVLAQETERYNQYLTSRDSMYDALPINVFQSKAREGISEIVAEYFDVKTYNNMQNIKLNAQYNGIDHALQQPARTTVCRATKSSDMMQYLNDLNITVDTTNAHYISDIDNKKMNNREILQHLIKSGINIHLDFDSGYEAIITSSNEGYDALNQLLNPQITDTQTETSNRITMMGEDPIENHNNMQE